MNINKARYIPVICFIIAAAGFFAAGILAIRDSKTIISVLLFICTILNLIGSAASYYILKPKENSSNSNYTAP